MFTLARAGTSIVFAEQNGELTITHWGAEVNPDPSIAKLMSRPVAHGGLDVAPRNTLLREHSRGWLGRPTLQGHRHGSAVATHFELLNSEQGDGSLILRYQDLAAELALKVTFNLAPSGLLTVDQELTNLGKGEYSLSSLIGWLPLPERAAELIDFHGRWTKERQMQRRAIAHGLTVREGFEGRSGHDETIVQLATTAGADFQNGEVWALAIAWSGNNSHFVEHLIDGNLSIGAGENLLPGEVILGSGESYIAPQIWAAYSGEGIDGISHSFYQYVRSRPQYVNKNKPRPLSLNMWEAVYFDHSMERITPIVDAAAKLGVERVVLDDGWFGARRDDRAGLGDWVISKEVWPNGLAPLSDYVNSKGMEFGLWFEGEMIQADSDVFRAHPDWILQSEGRWPVEGRRQQVLDLTKPEAFEHLRHQVQTVLDSCKVSYIKWDHNRSLTDPISNGRPAVRNQTLAIYRLFDRLKADNPGLEIESCASGGGRVDLGMLLHADRFWTSDQNDALERQHIQRWTSIAIPPEYLGTHVGPTHGHQTYRTHDIRFRALNALFGHSGIEWDVTLATEDEQQVLDAYIKFFKENRELLHSGRVNRQVSKDENTYVHGVVSQDKSRAIFTVMQLGTSTDFGPDSIRLPGLDTAAKYQLSVVTDLSAFDFIQKAAPAWWPEINTTGAILSAVGLQLPVLRPESGILLEVRKM